MLRGSKSRVGRGLVAVGALGLLAGLVAWSARPAAAQDGQGVREELKRQKESGHMVERLKRVNEELRRQVGDLMSAGARTFGATLGTEQMIISSLNHNVIVAGAPVEGARVMIRGAFQKGEGKGQFQSSVIQDPVAPPGGQAGQEPKEGPDKRDKLARYGRILGIVVVGGPERRAVEAGGGEGVLRKAPGSVPLGGYAICGESTEDLKQVRLVGEDGNVLATVRVDPSWSPGRDEQSWWKVVYMSILGSVVPLVE